MYVIYFFGDFLKTIQFGILWLFFHIYKNVFKILRHNQIDEKLKIVLIRDILYSISAAFFEEMVNLS